MTDSKKGQALIVAILLIAVMSVLIPAMVWWSGQESRLSVKQKKSTTAFHLAEAGIDRARWKLLESTNIWLATSSSTVSGYNFDKVYSDLNGGTYAIKISSDPADKERRIVEAVGRDPSTNELRKIRAVYANTGGVSFSVRANKTVTLGANVDVEWGPIMSGTNVDTNNRTYPRYYSAGHVTPQDGGSVGSKTDNVQWWSYYQIPPPPSITMQTIIDSATASGAAPNDCGNGTSSSYKYTGNAIFKGCHDTSNKTYYITGTAEFQSGGGGNFITGTVAVMGNVTIQGNGGGDGNYNAKVPPQAWKEYGNNWAHYQIFDAGAPATYTGAVSANYVAVSTLTYPLSSVLIKGFLYTGGSLGLTGGGGAKLHGVIMSANDATINTSNLSIYYDNEVASRIPVSGIYLNLVSWDELAPSWPGGL